MASLDGASAHSSTHALQIPTRDSSSALWLRPSEHQKCAQPQPPPCISEHVFHVEQGFSAACSLHSTRQWLHASSVSSMKQAAAAASHPTGAPVVELSPVDVDVVEVEVVPSPDVDGSPVVVDVVLSPAVSLSSPAHAPTQTRARMIVLILSMAGTIVPCPGHRRSPATAPGACRGRCRPCRGAGRSRSPAPRSRTVGRP